MCDEHAKPFQVSNFADKKKGLVSRKMDKLNFADKKKGLVSRKMDKLGRFSAIVFTVKATFVPPLCSSSHQAYLSLSCCSRLCTFSRDSSI